MPWPVHHNMTDHQIDAIYEYLSAIPCLEGSPDPNNILHNDCGEEKQSYLNGIPYGRSRK